MEGEASMDMVTLPRRGTEMVMRRVWGEEGVGGTKEGAPRMESRAMTSPGGGLLGGGGQGGVEYYRSSLGAQQLLPQRRGWRRTLQLLLGDVPEGGGAGLQGGRGGGRGVGGGFAKRK